MRRILFFIFLVQKPRRRPPTSTERFLLPPVYKTLTNSRKCNLNTHFHQRNVAYTRQKTFQGGTFPGGDKPVQISQKTSFHG